MHFQKYISNITKKKANESSIYKLKHAFYKSNETA